MHKILNPYALTGEADGYKSELSVAGYTTYIIMLIARENLVRSTQYVRVSGLITEGNSKQEISTVNNSYFSLSHYELNYYQRMRPCRIYPSNDQLQSL
jgi:hypothetical protein